MRVRGTIEGVSYRTSLLSRGDGELFLVVPRPLRDRIGKTAGETVELTLSADLRPVVVRLPPDFRRALGVERTRFDRLAPSRRKAHLRWITDAKQPETRRRRIDQTVQLLRSDGKGALLREPRTEIAGRGRERRGVPPPFEISRELGPGNYPLLKVFPGFTEVPPFARYPADPRKRRSLARGTTVQVVDERAWMCVAPIAAPPWATKYGWNPFTSPTDCIVVGRRHLAKSPSIALYLDILHVFCHIVQRDAGRELWDITQG
jgi:bifunctional DNA-binding transcriptional regulator/antitoxin component of YhaV-PrlF toxin-antitoxin module